MRVDTSSRYTQPDQRFFFPPNHPALGTAEFCAEEHPKVVNDADMLLTLGFTDVNGTDRYAVQGPNSWLYPIPMGATITGVFESAPRDIIHARHQRQSLAEAERVSLDLPADTQVIWRADWQGIHGTYEGNRGYDQFADDHQQFVHPLGEPLPAYEGVEPEYMRFEPLGFIRPDLSLYTYGANDWTEEMVDMAVAHKKASNQLEVALVGFKAAQRSLPGTLAGWEAPHLYLQWYDQQTGESFTPTTEPRDRVAEFPSFTPKQTRRWDRIMRIYDDISSDRQQIET